MGQTSTEAQREVEKTREHLTQTLDAIQLKARRNLDVGTQLKTNRAVQVSTAALLLGIAGLSFLAYRRRTRRSAAERLVRKLKLSDLRDRVTDFMDDARAWATAQKRIIRADSKSKPAEVERRDSVVRRLLVSVLEAGLTALAAGYARKIISGVGSPERGRAAESKKR